MNTKIKIAAALLLIGIIGVGVFAWRRGRSQPPVLLVLEVTVNPPDQAGFVMAKARSARFKYLLGKISSTNPYLAQRLELKPLPDSGRLEARIGVRNREEAKQYAEAFVEVLQSLCGPQAQLKLDRQAIR